MYVPVYIQNKIHRTYRGSIREWWNFRYAPLPNKFSMIMLAMMLFPLLGVMFWFNPEIALIERLLQSAIDLVICDVILYWLFTDKRILLAFQKYERGEDWQNIHPWDVDMC